MILLDTNLLIYAYNTGVPQHKIAQRWLLSLLSAGQPIGLAWLSLSGFIRLMTGKRVLATPLSVEEAVERLEVLLSNQSVHVLQPTERFWPIYRNLLEQTNASGNLSTDAYLAALAIDHGATFATHDRDFQRWQPFGLSVVYPLA